jgi:hypothetical protein
MLVGGQALHMHKSHASKIVRTTTRLALGKQERAAGARDSVAVPECARFRQRRETALTGLFGAVLALCAEVSLARVGCDRDRRDEGSFERVRARDAR